MTRQEIVARLRHDGQTVLIQNQPSKGDPTTRPEVARLNQAEREFETGTHESFKNTSATAGAVHGENQRVAFANIKRNYDLDQDLDIQAARQALVEQT